MTKYDVTGSFEMPEMLSNDDREYILTNLMEVLPVTARGDMKIEVSTEHVDVFDLSSDDIGSRVRLYTGTDHEVAGTLGGVFQAAGSGITLIVDGRSYAVGAYEVAELVPSVTVGEKTPDEPEEDLEESEELYPGMSGIEIQEAIATEIRSRLEEAPGEVATGAGILFRSQVESFAGRELSPEEFQLVAAVTAQDMNAVLAPVIGAIIRDNVAALEAHQAQHQQN